MLIEERSEMNTRFYLTHISNSLGFPDGFVGEDSACNAGDAGLIAGLGRSCGERNGNPLQCSCLKTPMNRGTW